MPAYQTILNAFVNFLPMDAECAIDFGCGTGTIGAPSIFGQSSVNKNSIQIENTKPGTRDWMLSKVDITANEPVELWRSPRIEGYCSGTSVAAGETLKVMISANPVSEFDLEIFRTDYYGGDGARSVKTFTSI